MRRRRWLYPLIVLGLAGALLLYDRLAGDGPRAPAPPRAPRRGGGSGAATLEPPPPPEAEPGQPRAGAAPGR